MASCSSSKNGSCISAAPSSVPASIATTTLLVPVVATTNSSQYANESCLAEPQQAKLGQLTDKKQEEEAEAEEEDSGQREEKARSRGKEEGATSGTSSTSEHLHTEKKPGRHGGEEPKQLQMQVDSNEAQENVRMSVLVEPERSLPDDDSSAWRNSSSLHHQQPAADYSGDCCGASDNEANQQRRRHQQSQHQVMQKLAEDEAEEQEEAEGGENEEEMERRLFGLSLTDEMKKQLRKQRFKLFSRAHLKKRKRKRQPAGSNQLGGGPSVPTASSTGGESRVRPSERLKSALTRQGTTTANYADLGQDSSWMQEMQTASFQSGLGKQAPSIKSTHHGPLMQKLFSLDKLGSGSSPLLVHHPQLLASDHHMPGGGHPRLFVSPALEGPASPSHADLLNSWAASDPTGARSALVKHAQSKMIPIEIIGLDPQVTKSILLADSASSASSSSAEEALGSSSFASDSSMDTPTLASFPRTLGRPKTSILHVHHFHTTRPLLGQTQLPASLDTSGAVRHAANQQLNLRQAFLNERGEIVYLDNNAASLAGAGLLAGRIEPQFMPQDSSLEHSLDLNTLGGPPDAASNKLLSYPAPTTGNQGGAMVQYVPAGSHLSQQSLQLNNKQQDSTSRQRFLTTTTTNTNGQIVSVMEPSSGAQQQSQVNSQDEQQQQQQIPAATHQHQSSEDKMLMVAYRPQQSTGISGYNHSSIDESMLNNKYNEGQESKASMVSAGGLVLRPLSNLLQTVIPHRNQATDYFGSAAGADFAHLPFASASSQALNNKGAKLHLPAGVNSNSNSTGVPSAALRQHSHHQQEPDLMIKGPPPVDSQSFWLGAPSEQPLLSSFPLSPPLPVASLKNNSHQFAGVSHLPAETNPRRLQQVQAVGQSRSQVNGTLTAPSQDFLRKLLKGLQLHKDTGQNLSFALSHQQLGSIKSPGSMQLTKSLNRDINQPPASQQQQQQQQQQSLGKPIDSSQHRLRNNHQTSMVSLNEAALRELQGASSASDATDGLGNITLAFISVVSLLTLILIAGAASMLYRNRRRSSVSRCGSLPARSRLNLTHRTKRFMRSNFVRPDQGITPIKRVDLDSNCSSPAAKLGSPLRPPLPPSSGQPEDCLGAQRVPAMGVKPTSGDKYNPAKPTGVSAQLLSTFNGSAPATGNHATTATTSPTADIKTLNTRLHKSSYLKSLISGPSCVSAQLGCSSGHKQHHGRKLANPVDAVCYLGSSNNTATNYRQQSDAVVGNSLLESHEPDKICSVAGQRSHSFKNLSSSSCDHNYSFARKPGSSDRNSIDSKHFNINRLPTINSESDNNLNSSSKFSDSDSSNQPQQHHHHHFKQRNQLNGNNITCRANELNQPTRHHIADKFLMERRL